MLLVSKKEIEMADRWFERRGEIHLPVFTPAAEETAS